MIISCPSCKTDYSVSNSIIKGIEDPRFHCAICDHYFELGSNLINSLISEQKEQLPPTLITSYTDNTNSKSAQLPNQNEHQEETTAPSSAENTKSDDNFHGSSKTSLHSRLLKHRSLFHRPSNQTNPSHPVSDNTYHQQQAAAGSGTWKLSDSYGTSAKITNEQQSPSIMSSSQVQYSAAPIADLSSSKKQSGQSNWRNIGGSTQVNTAAKIADWPAPPSPPQGILNKKTPELKSSPSSNWPHGKSSLISRKSHRIKDILSTIIVSLVEIPKRLIKRPHRDQSWLGRIRDKSQIFNASPRPKGLLKIRFNLHALLFLAIPALILVAILYWNKQVQSADVPLSGVLSVSKEQIPKVAPIELELVNVSSQLVTLDDGKKVIVVSGKVFNSSSITYRDVKVEASLFDKNNRTIQTLVVPLKNGLSVPSKINTLKVDAINALQKKQLNSDQQITPTQSLPFKVVFTSHIDSASYFSSRVYSVKNNDTK